MRVDFHRYFEKNYHKLSEKEHAKFKERLTILIADEFHPLLNNHALAGKYLGYRSISIGGDLRAIYRHLSADRIVFVSIGSHFKLYE